MESNRDDSNRMFRSKKKFPDTVQFRMDVEEDLKILQENLKTSRKNPKINPLMDFEHILRNVILKN